VGENYVCVVDNGAAKCFGANDYGQLGSGKYGYLRKPSQVIGLSEGVIAISASKNHTCALLNSGQVKCWGSNVYGKLGAGQFENIYNILEPVDVICPRC